MRVPNRFELRTKWKTVLVIVVAAAASFSIGAFANQVVVQQVQSLAGNHVLVPAPELKITSSFWSINGTASLITGVTLNITTVGGAGTTGFKLYKVYIQVSCFNNATQTGFTCATGNNSIILPVNMNGTSTRLNVPITPPIDPETIEVHDLSFIVTGNPVTCKPDFAFTASTNIVNLTISHAISFVPPPPVANVTKTFTSLCGFSGTINIAAAIAPATGLAEAIIPATVTLTFGGTATAIDEIVGAASGTYTITVIATSGALTHTITINVGVS